jgi:hypothetical protein
VYFSAFVTKIESDAFKGCATLKDLWFPCRVASLDAASGAFAGIAPNAVLHLPATLTAAERSTAEALIKAAGAPSGISFDYYTLK